MRRVVSCQTLTCLRSISCTSLESNLSVRDVIDVTESSPSTSESEDNELKRLRGNRKFPEPCMCVCVWTHIRYINTLKIVPHKLDYRYSYNTVISQKEAHTLFSRSFIWNHYCDDEDADPFSVKSNSKLPTTVITECFLVIP